MTDTRRLEQRLDRLERQLAVANRAVGLVHWTFVFDGPRVADCRCMPEGDDASDMRTWMTLSDAILHFSLDRETGERVLAGIQARVDARAPDFELEYPVRQADGTVQWRLARGAFRYGADGAPIAMDGIAMDITARKLGAEAAERKTRTTEMLTQAARLLQVGVWRYDLEDGEINLATAELINAWESLGFDPATAPTDFNESIALLVVPEDQPGLVAALDAAVRGDTSTFETEFRMRHANGSIRWHLARGIVSRDDTGKPLSFIGTSYDVTALKAAEEETRRVKDQLELSIFGSKAATWSNEVPDGRLEDLHLSHTNFVELLGYTRAEIPDDAPNAVAAVMTPESAAMFYRDMEAQLHGTDREWESVYQFHAKDGSDRWLLSRGVIQRVAETGVANRFTGISIDITERVLAERALRESEQRFRTMFETTAVGFCLSSPAGDCLDCNETLGRLLGYAREEIVGKNFPGMFYGEDLEETRGRMQDLLAGRVTHNLFDGPFRT
jgi:PAS domain S-box-containing protein